MLARCTSHFASQDQGDLAQALHMYEKCVELAPSSDKPAQNRLLALNYLPDADAGLIYQASRSPEGAGMGDRTGGRGPP